jgi:hypothetical protein
MVYLLILPVLMGKTGTMDIKSFKEVQISKPCHEDWDLMEKREKGRFCLNCKELVHDFTRATASDLNNLFKNNNGNLCGRFYEDQINQNPEFGQT